ncbi:MAG: hypothetical protein JNN20_12835 [Betaproteobacteria bacterium]|nr:hypothetical protein [Betaproteobacteria bacterium]
MFRSLLIITLLSAASIDVAQSATLHVATSGSNQKGNGSAAKPWATIGHGLRRLKGGDTLVVQAGIYSGLDQFINTRLSPIESGRAGAFTTIRAEPPFSVRIRNAGALKHNESMVFLGSETQYVHIDGFVFDMVNTYEPAFIASVEGSRNKLTRNIFRREGIINDYAAWVGIGGKYNLLEDCAGVGAARYGFITGGPESSASNNIFRRCVARIDYANSPLPKAAFVVYGNNNTDAVRDMLLQNCMVIDSQRGPSQREDTYGGFYFAKNATNITVQGGVVLNSDVGHAAYFVNEQQGRNVRVEHSVAWDIRGHEQTAAIRANGDGGEMILFDHLTVGKVSGGFVNRTNARDRILKNSLFVDVGAMALLDKGWSRETNNAFSPSSLSRGRTAITGNVLPRYLLRAEPASATERKADDGTDVGARQMLRYGAAGTLWGEPGFDKLTTEPLWPWPNEDAIKAVFAERNDAPTGFVPPRNDTRRGFAAEKDRYGQAMTLTRYLWQYLGHPIPAEIYGR